MTTKEFASTAEARAAYFREGYKTVFNDGFGTIMTRADGDTLHKVAITKTDFLKVVAIEESVEIFKHHPA